MSKENNAIHNAYVEGAQDLYEWLYDTAKEWHGLNIVTDSQYIALLMLLHEGDKRVMRLEKNSE